MPNRSWLPIVLVLSTLPSAASATDSPVAAFKRQEADRKARSGAIEQQLQRGEWAPALAAIQREVDRALQPEGGALGLGRLVAWRAIAEAGLGRAEDASWDWQMAQNLTGAPPFDAAELAAYGAPGKLLAERRLRKVGEAPAGLEVRKPGSATGTAGEVLAAKKIEGAAPELPAVLRARSIPKWLTAELVVDAEGRPRDPVVLVSRLPEMTYAVLQAVRGWKFAPATAGGAPVASFYDLSANPPSGKPLEQLVRLDDTLGRLAGLLREGKWEEADKRTQAQWDRVLDNIEQGAAYLGVLLTLRALAEAGRGHEAQAICRWSAAQTLEPLLFHAGLAAYGRPGGLLESNRWGAYSTRSESPAASGARAPAKPSGVSRPRILERTDPRYPFYLAKTTASGSVIIEAIIDRDGVLREAQILRSSGWHDLDASALDAVCDWRFAPATFEGRPVSVYYTLTVNFEVRK